MEWGSFKINEDKLFGTCRIAVDNGKVAKVKDLGLRRVVFTAIFITGLIVLLLYLAQQ